MRSPLASPVDRQTPSRLTSDRRQANARVDGRSGCAQTPTSSIRSRALVHKQVIAPALALARLETMSFMRLSRLLNRGQERLRKHLNN
jgi:hypothetical protein